MSSKLTVVFYIILCLEAGVVLTLLPWVHPFGLGDWGDNYFLLYASQKIGLQGLQYAMASGWVRGAVTGLGLLNLGMAFWEMAHFRTTVRSLQAQEDAQRRPGEAATQPQAPAAAADAARDARRAADALPTSTPDDLPHHGRTDDTRDHPGR